MISDLSPSSDPATEPAVTDLPAPTAPRVGSITVLIPAYNVAEWLPEAIESALGQTRPPDEILVVDDGSTDGTVEVARRYPGVRVVALARNRGTCAARNVGIRAARGELIAFLDADDWWEPRHLETLEGLLRDAPTAAVACSGGRMVGWEHEQDWLPCLPEREACDAFYLALQSTVAHHSSVLVRRSALQAVNGYDERIPHGVDFHLYVRLAARFPFVGTSDVTSFYRYRPGQISSTRPREEVVFARWRARLWREGELRQWQGPDITRFVSTVLWALWEQGAQRVWRAGDRGGYRLMMHALRQGPPVAITVRLPWVVRARLPRLASRTERSFEPLMALARRVKGLRPAARRHSSRAADAAKATSAVGLFFLL